MTVHICKKRLRVHIINKFKKYYLIELYDLKFITFIQNLIFKLQNIPVNSIKMFQYTHVIMKNKNENIIKNSKY